MAAAVAAVAAVTLNLVTKVLKVELQEQIRIEVDMVVRQENLRMTNPELVISTILGLKLISLMQEMDT